MIPVGFEPSGKPFRFTSAEQPPDVPVLALVPIETNFDHTPVPSFSSGDCDPTAVIECPDEGEGGATINWGNLPTGIYMTAAHLPDDHEGFMMGAPEFEVHLQVQQTSPDTARDVRCVGADAPDPTSHYDQNNATWEGAARLASLAEVEQFRLMVPDSSGATFVVWEDDTDPCVIREDPEHWTWWFGVLGGTNAGVAMIALGGVLDILGGAGVLAGVVSIVADLLGGQADDVVGAFSHTGCSIPGNLGSGMRFNIVDFGTSGHPVEGCMSIVAHNQ